MVLSKKFDLAAIIIFLFLSVFSLGQLVKLPLNIYGVNTPLVPIDLLAIIASIVYVIPKNKLSLLSTLPSVFFAAFLSLLFSFSLVSISGATVGVLYFIRILSYYYFYLFLKDYIAKNGYLQEIILQALIYIGGMIAVLGLIQYFVYPDLTGIVALGWDNHLYRLVGSFIDPGFTGLFLAFAIIVSIYSQRSKFQKKYVFISSIMLIALLLTYSRAAYLAYFAGLFALFVQAKSFRKISFIYAIVFLVSIPLLPRPNSIGVKLERTGTVVHRINNYEETLAIWQKNPVLGVGYNSICAYKKEVLNVKDIGIHSCSGADSSILLLLATTGIVGGFAFLSDSIKLIKVSTREKNTLFIATLFSLFIHSLFVNSMFYSWSMGWLVLVAVSTFAFKKSD